MILMTDTGRFCLATHSDFTDPRHFVKAAMKKYRKMEPPADVYVADVAMNFPGLGSVQIYHPLYPNKPEGCEPMWVADFGEGGKHETD